ncbi:hypothetical protein ACIBAG_35190 [Streptomyces sp. NPDC051243]|uniref:hypothetical protein n=1 Tax=Streptomyces sp. NPDC051243 TaxID=3365646 RepID=UPI00379B52E3
MGVFDSQWWSMWWPEMVLWLVTALCLAVALWYALVRSVTAYRRARQDDEQPVSGVCVYLHERRAEEVADFLRIPRSDLRVSRKVDVSRDLGLSSKLPGAGAKAGQTTGSTTTTETEELSTPMKTIGLIMDKLREKDKVVDVDLATGQLVPTRALADRLRGTADEDNAPLTAIRRTYVSVSGLFTIRRADGGGVVLRARYGDGRSTSHVKITCERSWVRDETWVDSYSQDEEFSATCLGLVRTWNGTRSELTLEPVCIFL